MDNELCFIHITDPTDIPLGCFHLCLDRHVISKETEFQQVDVIQLLDPRFESTASYQKSLSNDGSYESRHPELFDPNVMVYLDGQIQSSLKGEKAYHEGKRNQH